MVGTRIARELHVKRADRLYAGTRNPTVTVVVSHLHWYKRLISHIDLGQAEVRGIHYWFINALQQDDERIARRQQLARLPSE